MNASYRVRAALDLLKPEFHHYVQGVLLLESPDEMTRPETLVRKGFAVDMQSYFRIVLGRWDEWFQRAPEDLRDCVKALNVARNQWAHEETFSPARAAAVERLCRDVLEMISATDYTYVKASPASANGRAGEKRRSGAVSWPPPGMAADDFVDDDTARWPRRSPVAEFLAEPRVALRLGPDSPPKRATTAAELRERRKTRAGSAPKPKNKTKATKRGASAKARASARKVASRETILDYLRREGFKRPIDLRDAGGCLWVKCSEARFVEHRDELRKRRIVFTFAKNGGKATGHRPGWWTKSPK